MNSIKLMALSTVALLTVGCVTTLPKIAAIGKFQVIYVGGMPVVEFEYPSAEACAVDANKIQEIDPDSRRAIADGKMRIECSAYSLDDRLKFKSTVRNVITGQVYPTKTYSKEGCIFLSKQNKDQSLRYGCVDE